MKSGYEAIDEEGETNSSAGDSETGRFRIVKKHQLFWGLGLFMVGLLMGHLTRHPGLPTNKESADLLDSKEDGCSKKGQACQYQDCCDNLRCCGARGDFHNWQACMKNETLYECVDKLDR